MKILVTGGAGYIGAELVYQLSKLPGIEKIFVYDNLSRGNFNLFISNRNRIHTNNVEFVMGDLLDSRKIRKVLDQGVDIVYHLAAKVGNPFQGVDSHLYEQTNNWGTAELVYAVEDSSSVKKFVYLSTVGVYGFSRQGEILTEASRLNPRSFYDIAKMRAEEHVMRLMDKMETVIYRAGNVYGYTPSISFESVINRFLFESNFNGRISVHGSGNQHRSFIHVAKLVKALTHLAVNDIPKDVYNVADKTYKILDLVDIFKEIFPELEFIFINQHLDLRDLSVDTNMKLRKYIDLPETDLKQELIDFKQSQCAF